MKTNTIGLGDTVRFNWDGDGFQDGKVTKVYADGSIDVFRPYVHTSDFSHYGGEEGSLAVIAYIGFETVKRLEPQRVRLIRKGDPVR